MTTHLVSLISEHLLPNFLLAKEMEGKFDRHIFITTARMGESMTARFCNALKIDKKDIQIVIVSEDDLPDARKKLNKCNFSKDDGYIINLTGGTKIMSIAIFQHFFKYEAEYYYIPIGINKIENVRTGEDVPLNYRINVEEYLSLYGLHFKLKATKYETGNNPGERFEKYIFNRIKNDKCLNDEHIKRGVEIFRDNEQKTNDNEIDVVWTIDNQIFVGECKVSLSPPTGRVTRANPVNYLDQIMYKLSAISKDFGLRVNPYIFIKTPLKPTVFNADRMKAIAKRLQILGIKGLLTGNDFKQQKLKI
ncbi:MAG: DUF1887 family protein [Candidatus Symbiothrix sp.]|jgi:hypothetical protein|nr:DUF1887 family protein [Candidatus Symbiothrix sp.]